jgi:hypothetical protein
MNEDFPTKVSPFLVPFLSFFSANAYRSVGMDWRGAAALYTLGVILVSWVLVAPKMNGNINANVNVLVEAAGRSLPSFEIRGGKFRCEGEMPIVVGGEAGKDSPGIGRVAIIDTRITDPGDKKPDNYPFVLVTSDRLVYFKSPAETRVINFSGIPDMAFSKERVRGIAERIRGVILPFLLLALIPVSYIGAMLKILAVASTVGIGAAALMSKNWTFGQVFRVCAVAVTPSLCVRTMAEVCGLGGILVAIVGLALTLFFTIFGIATFAAKNSNSACQS